MMTTMIVYFFTNYWPVNGPCYYNTFIQNGSGTVGVKSSHNITDALLPVSFERGDLSVRTWFFGCFTHLKELLQGASLC